MGKFLGIYYDKWLHLMAGYIIMITVSLFCGYIIGASVTVAIAILKEIWDEWKAGAGDKNDFYFTIAGIVPAYIILQLYIYKTLITC